MLSYLRQSRRFTGVEFALVNAAPPSMFIIHKRERLSPEEGMPLILIFALFSTIL
jgi:mediator of RNA polymerase II transcription subunit 6